MTERSIGDKISVVIPAYNEGKTIYKNLNSFIKAFEEMGINFEVVLVDDGSTDNTWREASRVNHPSLKCFRLPENGGKGHALNYGVYQSEGNYITFMDADADLPPGQLKLFMDYLSKNGASGVVGSKRHPLSQVSYPLKRRFLSYCYHLFTRLLFNLSLKDTQAGMKLFKRGTLRSVLPRILVKKYAFDLEVLAVASHLGYNIVEAPIVINYKFNGSGVNLRQIWHIFIDTLAIFYRMRVLRYYDHERGFYLNHREAYPEEL